MVTLVNLLEIVIQVQPTPLEVAAVVDKLNGDIIEPLGNSNCFVVILLLNLFYNLLSRFFVSSLSFISRSLLL